MNTQQFLKLASIDFSNKEDEIKRLKKQKNKSLLWSILSGTGKGALKGGLFGAGAGAIGLFPYLGMTGESLQTLIEHAPYIARFGASSCAMGGIPLGGLLGGINSAWNYKKNKQQAIDRLKELGVYDE